MLHEVKLHAAALLCVGLAKDGCRLYVTFEKIFASTSRPLLSKRKMSIFHSFIG